MVLKKGKIINFVSLKKGKIINFVFYGHFKKNNSFQEP